MVGIIWKQFTAWIDFPVSNVETHLKKTVFRIVFWWRYGLDGKMELTYFSGQNIRSLQWDSHLSICQHSVGNSTAVLYCSATYAYVRVRDIPCGLALHRTCYYLRLLVYRCGNSVGYKSRYQRNTGLLQAHCRRRHHCPIGRVTVCLGNLRTIPISSQLLSRQQFEHARPARWRWRERIQTLAEWCNAEAIHLRCLCCPYDWFA